MGEITLGKLTIHDDTNQDVSWEKLGEMVTKEQVREIVREELLKFSQLIKDNTGLSHAQLKDSFIRSNNG